MEPENISRYEIKAEIGRGGMATVYRAYDPRFKREVAIKVLPSQFLHDPTFRARFEREAMTIAAIEHPGIVPVYDYGEENGQPYLVMRYVQGGSLSDILKKGPLTFREAAHIVSQLAPALDEMHSRGIIHRDLKPGNILFDHYGNACISDFGIARLTEATTTLTGDAIIGTPSYMSPEQARGDTDIDGRSDIYALGAILFEMLTGKQPYQATTPMGIVMKHITDPIPRILEYRADLPPSTENVITRAMAKKRDDRFHTARDLAAAQEAIVLQLSSRQTAETKLEKISPLETDAPSPAVGKPQPAVPQMPLEDTPHVGKPVVDKPVAKPAVETKPPVESPHPAGKPATVGSTGPTPVVRPPVSVPPPIGLDSGESAKPSSVKVYPQPSVTPSHPASEPALRPARPAEKTRTRSLIFALGGVAVIFVLCLLAGALGLPRLLGVFNPNKTPTPAAVTPATTHEVVTNPPTGVNTPAPGKQVDHFVDNFQDPNSGWDRRTYDGNITDYEGGFYRIYIDKPNTFYWSNPHLDFSDVKMEVEATKTSGPDNNFFGLICRYQDAYNYYMLAISSDGYYSIRKYQNDNVSFLGNSNWTFSPNIHQGKTTNILRGDCVGDTLTLIVNGTKLLDAQDNTFAHGDVGLTAAALDLPGTNILFDNFVADKP